MSYALSRTVDLTFDEAVTATRDALVDNGFGVLTEIDLAATLADRTGTQVPPQIILGACRPPLALAALEAEPDIGLLLPCNVVVRAEVTGGTVVSAVDPLTLVELTANPSLQSVADDAGARLASVLAALPSARTAGS